MKIFISDIPVNIVSKNSLLKPDQYDSEVDARQPNFSLIGLTDDILVQNAPIKLIDDFLVTLNETRPKELSQITFLVSDYNKAIEHIKKNFTIIKAAGGMVMKDQKVLLINRFDKWDLPKGKLGNGEKTKRGAIREVEEECNIKVVIDKKICSTWHTYKRNGNRILKQTVWYSMTCIDDSKMSPQIEEDITEVKWMDYWQSKQALINSYSSIRHVFKRYFRSDL